MPVLITATSTSTQSPTPAGLPRNVPQAFLQSVANHPDQLAVAAVDGSLELTWAQLRVRVRVLAAGLARLGVGQGDTVGLMLKNRPEFMLADVAVMCLGAVPFSIYATMPASQIVPILDNADARVVLCEKSFLPLLCGARAMQAVPVQLVVLDGEHEEARSWADLEDFAAAADFDLEARIGAISPDDIAALIYTSGTTGPAKGVELTHASVLAIADISAKYLFCRSMHRYLSWLPAAGMAERICNHYLPIVFGGTVYYCDDTRLAAQALPKARPHVFFGPPRFWEKLRQVIEAQWAQEAEHVRHEISSALHEQFERVRLEQAGGAIPVDLAERCDRSDREWFAPLRKRLGLDAEQAYVASGGAAAPLPMLEFFFAIGLRLDEVYGQTESAAMGTRSPRDQMRMGTVGMAQPGVEVRLADDGEILLRSPALMRGYRKQAAATREVMDADGWLHTGDIGTVDADGYYRIVDRKKEMIINSFGKNMSPSNIEAALTSAGPCISQAVVIGEARHYNVALLTLDSLWVRNWAGQNGIPADSAPSVIDPRLVAEVDVEVRRANEQLARVEQIKKFHIIGQEWLPGSDEITSTMKLKRRVINEKYAGQIEALYQTSGEQPE